MRNTRKANYACPPQWFCYGGWRKQENCRPGSTNRPLENHNRTSTNMISMKTSITSALLVSALAVLVSCASPQRGPAYGHEKEFRRQLAESIPVKEYGYTIKELMFSDDYRKALVIFTHPNSQARMSEDYNVRRPDWEFTLESNGFRRYRGMETVPFYTPGGNTRSVYITVVLPEK
jgi:hypothetical protein